MQSFQLLVIPVTKVNEIILTAFIEMIPISGK